MCWSGGGPARWWAKELQSSRQHRDSSRVQLARGAPATGTANKRDTPCRKGKTVTGNLDRRRCPRESTARPVPASEGLVPFPGILRRDGLLQLLEIR
ncbi:hypothetical protein HN011_007206 [Eciton burchellii]|nr:hypothetical protein HN011_007206 [Eciton burchellii]